MKKERMTPFEKYLKLKEQYGCEENNYVLQQYLSIVQVMNIEEKNYKKHRKELLDWLSNIEKIIKRLENERENQ